MIVLAPAFTALIAFLALRVFPSAGLLRAASRASASAFSILSRYSVSACFTILLAERDEVGSAEGSFTRFITHS